MASVDGRAVELARDLTLAVSARMEGKPLPWLSRDPDIQRAYDALRSHLTGEPLPPYSEAELDRYRREVEARKA